MWRDQKIKSRFAWLVLRLTISHRYGDKYVLGITMVGVSVVSQWMCVVGAAAEVLRLTLPVVPRWMCVVGAAAKVLQLTLLWRACRKREARTMHT